MSGVGIYELLIIIVIAVVVFGAPAIVAFWIGYQAGKKAERSAAAPFEETPAHDAEESASDE